MQINVGKAPLNRRTSSSDISVYHTDFHEGHSTVGEWQGSGRVVAGSWQGRGRVVAGSCKSRGRGTAWERHGMCESVFKTAGERHGMCESAFTVPFICMFVLQ